MASNSNDKSTLDEILEDLNRAEKEICNILSIAEKTCNELEQVPNSDTDILSELASQYFASVKNTRSLMMKHVNVVGKESTSAAPSSNGTQNQLHSIQATIKKLDALEDQFS